MFPKIRWAHLTQDIKNLKKEYEEVVKAFEHSYTYVTHLYSATSTIVIKDGFRYAGIIESAYIIDELYVEIIAYGCHLPLCLLKLVYK